MIDRSINWKFVIRSNQEIEAGSASFGQDEPKGGGGGGARWVSFRSLFTLVFAFAFPFAPLVAPISTEKINGKGKRLRFLSGSNCTASKLGLSEVKLV